MERASKNGTGQERPQNMSFPHKPQVSPAQARPAVAEGLWDTKGRWGSQGPAAGKVERGSHISTAQNIVSLFCFHCTHTLPVPSPTNQLLRIGRCNTCTWNIREYLLQERAGEHCDTVWDFPEAVGGLVLLAGSLLGWDEWEAGLICNPSYVNTWQKT